jgi:hypothetical protein
LNLQALSGFLLSGFPPKNRLRLPAAFEAQLSQTEVLPPFAGNRQPSAESQVRALG